MTSALDRWEDEGGAPSPDLALRFDGGDLLEPERQILECLGAAVVDVWNELSTNVQRDLFRRGVANKTYDVVRLKEQIARFLRKHKDDSVSRSE